MALTPKSFQEIYTDYRNEAQARQDQLTDWNDGSINDILAGASSTAVQEIVRIMLDRFKLTFFSSAEGDDLEFLAVDHYGDKFARPGAQKAVGVVEFSRPNTDAGIVNIPAGTVVKTAPDANGDAQRYTVVLGVNMTGLTISASIEAIVAGPSGNVSANQINIIETALTDPSITVDNSGATAGGAETESDAEYRETILNLIQTLTGATCAAIKAAAEEVAGVEQATVVESVLTVIEWDEANSLPIGDPFRIVRAQVYVADANGTASQALLDNVELALFDIRSCGVQLEILAATAIVLNWTASISLNPSGPNFAALSLDDTPIVNSMTDYLTALSTGQSFDRAIARQAILAIWGPTGTDDLTDFVTSNPSGNVVPQAFEKLIPGTVEIA